MTKAAFCTCENREQISCAVTMQLMLHTVDSTIGLGANQRYVGYFSKSLHPPGSKFCLLTGLIGMFWGLENPCCTKLSVAGFL